MKRLTRFDILSSNDLPRSEVDCPEWGGSILVRGLTLGEMSSVTKAGDTTAMNLAAIVACVVDDVGTPLFTAEDLDALRTKSQAPLLRIVSEINRLSGMAPDAEAELGKPTEPEA